MKLWLGVALTMMLIPLSRAEDWPVWRGPNADGISAETGWNPTSSPRIKWSREVGSGYASVTVAAGRLYTAGHADGQDTIVCLNTESGNEIWQYSYPSSTGTYKGPRATPVIDGENLYMVSRDGVVTCLNARDGKLVWKTDVLKESGNKDNQWGIATSAVISGDLVLLNIGARGTALDKKSGKVVWKSKGEQSYASPVVVERGGKTMAFVFAAQSLEMVDVSNGASLASYPWKTQYGVNGADPLLVGDQVFITTGYDKGCALLDYSSGQLKKVWENSLMSSQFSSCVQIDGYIYGIDGQTKSKGYLRCLSVADGSEQWSMRIGFGSLMVADNKIIALDEKGTLYFARAVPEKYEELARFKTGLKQLCWTQPVLANGTIYCRNDKGTLIAIDVSK